MTKKSLLLSSNFGLKALGLAPVVIAEWSKIVFDAQNRGLRLVEFDASLTYNEGWSLIIESENGDEINNKNEVTNFNKRINKNIKSAFTLTKTFEEDFLNGYFQDVNFKGFFVPVTEIQNVNHKVLKSQLDFNSLLFKHFKYKDLFSAFLKCDDSTINNMTLTPSVIWLCVYFYSRFLQELMNEDLAMYEIYGKWYSEQFTFDSFYRRLPSEQVTILLLHYCEAVVSNTEDQWMSKHLVAKGSDSVRSFFIKHKSTFESLYGLLEADTINDVLLSEQSDIKNDFVSIFENDFDVLLVQEVLDNKSKLELSAKLPLLLQLQYGPNSVYNYSNVIKDSLFNNDKRKVGEILEIEESDRQYPNYYQVNQNIYIENVQYWFDLTLSARNDILKTAKSLLSVGERKFIEERCQIQSFNLLNFVSAPILSWQIEDGKVFPQWNVIEDRQPISLRKQHQQSKREVAKEREALEFHLKAIFNFQFKSELDAYIANNNPVFSIDELQRTWSNEIEKLLLRMSRKQKFYESRMEEFGISNSNLNREFKSAWLKEMLAIEDEVKPYIQFVRKAFQTALPIRKKTSFNKYRHVSDGVEFDPDTLFDQEKWIRADVMKVMESKLERGEAVQINTFCLDYSGSMSHDRMRNLYKILYLLVMGLENRKSFDAFHFFSNSFIEVVNFSDEFTNRKVLFRILQQVSNLSMGKVEYSGSGGTNISSGIRMSHEKMKTFVNDFRVKYPTANIVTSIFVITDGVPSLGISDIPQLSDFINEKRIDGDVEIKGIFIKSEDDFSANFMSDIFGEDNYVETTDFREGVNKFVKIMTETYKKQRTTYKWKQKKLKLGLSK